MIKQEKVVIKYMEILEKLSNMIKKNLIVNLCIVKKYLQVEKNTNEGFQRLHAPVILIDSVYRKHVNYCPSVFRKILFY